MNCRPVGDRLIDSRILFAVAAGLGRLEQWARRARLAAWNAAGRAAVASESVGGLDVFAVKMPLRRVPAHVPVDVSILAVDPIRLPLHAAERMIEAMEGAESAGAKREREAAERPTPGGQP